MPLWVYMITILLAKLAGWWVTACSIGQARRYARYISDIRLFHFTVGFLIWPITVLVFLNSNKEEFRRAGWCFTPNWPSPETRRQADGKLWLARIFDGDSSYTIIRRIHRVGIERFLNTIYPFVFHSDKYGDLYRIRIGEHNICILKVTDKMGNHYLFVPPEILESKVGVAWSFDLNVKDYAPEIET